MRDFPAFSGFIFDLDGVLTQTATIHADAWAKMFTEYFQVREARGDGVVEPFDIATDYPAHVDGKPRTDGARDLLKSRGIDLPHGSPADPPDAETICGLGNRKNEIFHELLHDQGAEVFPDARRLLVELQARGVPMAVVSSSKNCEEIVDAGGLAGFFRARVDGHSLRELAIDGKPAPDMFLEAARQIGVAPERAVVLEDAEVGVRAGQRGGFALVVGVDRTGHADALKRRGADVVVNELTDLLPLLTQPARRRWAADLPSAFDALDDLAGAAATEGLAVFLDYDGTLAPIVADPEQAEMLPGMREAVERIAEHSLVAVVSGRDFVDVEQLLDLPDSIVAGSHGFDIHGPQLAEQVEGAKSALPALEAAADDLRHRLAGVDGARLEHKRFALAIHFRNVAEAELPGIEKAVKQVAKRFASKLLLRGGKKIFELVPAIDWHKGRAVEWLADKLGATGCVKLYLGDDLTDEDAFCEWVDEGPGGGILVGDHGELTAARYRLDSVAEVKQFLCRLAAALGPVRPPHLREPALSDD